MAVALKLDGSASSTPVEILQSNATRERVARLREAVKMAGGQSKVARAAGIPISTLSGYMGEVDMKVGNLVALADAIGISVEWLATGRGPRESFATKSPLSPEDEPFQELFGSRFDRLAEALEVMDSILASRKTSMTSNRRAVLLSTIYEGLGGYEAEEQLSEPETG